MLANHSRSGVELPRTFPRTRDGTQALRTYAFRRGQAVSGAHVAIKPGWQQRNVVRTPGKVLDAMGDERCRTSRAGNRPPTKGNPNRQAVRLGKARARSREVAAGSGGRRIGSRPAGSVDLVDVNPDRTAVEPILIPLTYDCVAEEAPGVADRLVEAVPAMFRIVAGPECFEDLIALGAFAPEREEGDQLERGI
jgi:hypothetical protein